ncbi:imidazole glycerol phosphate synthase subunit HisH [Candidatus Omnitrophus magneticus]|uniref:Imidazole glycerol phosphate synthase subunit HisH n=1 Tax=Candidatus Omnitrophus magneticus TaxID=1609969 RepID=A0A0F0CNE7_9BACT|nr:imidazole glycerol phosphate synthase subunit HisH [Candidatus Omnitrophus magneticus]
MIGLVDYGAGNLRSVYNAFSHFGEKVKICVAGSDIATVDKLVLPGVGSSQDAMNGLLKADLLNPISDFLKKGKYFLGICLGLQILFENSEESGGTKCMGLISGNVKRFAVSSELKIPQIGWNTVKFVRKDCPIFKGIPDKSYFYFVHSYYCSASDKTNIAGLTEYGVPYTSILWKDNIFATQFHPERSQETGLKIIENFIKL